MQDFLEDGNLYPGIHEYTFEEFENQFILEFTTSETRKEIYANFCDWFYQLKAILTPRYMWLDGSFLTKKVNPNDLDLVIFYRPEDITSESLAAQLQKHIHVLSREFSCDAYLCLTLGHLNDFQKSQLGNVRIMETYWMGQFTFDRNRKPKGMVEISESEIQLFKGGVRDDLATRTD